MNVVENFIEYTKALGYGDKFEPAPGPTMLCFYFSIENKQIQINKHILEMRSYRTSLMLIDIEIKITDIFSQILDVINKIYKPLAKVYIHSLDEIKCINPIGFYPQRAICVRMASSHHLSICMNNKTVNNFIKKNGVVKILKDYPDELKDEPYLRHYIKSNHPQYTDQIQLFETLHGIKITKKEYSKRNEYEKEMAF